MCPVSCLRVPGPPALAPAVEEPGARTGSGSHRPEIVARAAKKNTSLLGIQDPRTNMDPMVMVTTSHKQQTVQLNAVQVHKSRDSLVVSLV